MMSKKQQRFRQLSIVDSFALSKKRRTQSSTMEKNLRDLMAAAAESRLSATTTKSSVQQPGEHQSKDAHEDFARAGTSACLDEQLKVPDPEESCLPESADLFPNSLDLFPDTPVLEQCSSQETVETDINISPSSSCSTELFVEEYEEENSQLDDEIESTEEQLQLTYLNRIPQCSISLPKLEPLENHFVGFSPHIRPGVAPRPFPNAYRDRWDPDHVRMPCSSQNKYPVEDSTGEKQIRSRWDLICRSLSRNIKSSHELEDAIMRYNFQYKGKWNFTGFHAFFNMCFKENERIHFFENILPVMISYALDLPNICTQPIPLLKEGKDYFVTISQKQIGCLLLNAFFCTFPRRNTLARQQKQRWNHEYASYPDINFNRLFSGGVKNKVFTNMEKLKCLINYFRRITTHEPTGTVTFHRQFLRQLPKWSESLESIKAVVVKSDGLIESDGHGMLQADFANKFIGGGVLGQGCVQEEIRFVICPELIVSRLFVECLGASEVLIVTGVEQYSKYSGYSDTFKWDGSYEDQTLRDAWGRRCTQVVAMDATHFANTSDQIKTFYIEKELNKAFCGFYEDAFSSNLPAVATGNWGCGVYKGNSSLKFIIQLMAASQAHRDMLYFTFGDKALKKELKSIYTILVENNLTVGDLWKILMNYSTTVKVIRKELSPKLYSFLHSLVNEYQTENKTLDITDSDKCAIDKLIKAVEEEDSSTDIEDSLINDSG